MTLGEMKGKVFISPEVKDRNFFKLAIVNDITHNYTLIEYDVYLFEYGRGLRNQKSDHSHITVFNRFYEERLEYSHKIITTIFGGIGDAV